MHPSTSLSYKLILLVCLFLDLDFIFWYGLPNICSAFSNKLLSIGQFTMYCLLIISDIEFTGLYAMLRCTLRTSFAAFSWTWLSPLRLWYWSICWCGVVYCTCGFIICQLCWSSIDLIDWWSNISTPCLQTEVNSMLLASGGVNKILMPSRVMSTLNSSPSVRIRLAATTLIFLSGS